MLSLSKASQAESQAEKYERAEYDYKIEGGKISNDTYIQDEYGEENKHGELKQNNG